MKTGNRERNKLIRQWLFIAALLLAPFAGLAAQEDFGFGDSDFAFGSSDFGFSSPGLSVSIGGELKAGFTGYFDYCGSPEKFKKIRLGDVVSGNLSFEAGSSIAQAVIKLNLTPVFDGSSPVAIDEAYLRAFFGPITIEGGLRKLSWGKADSLGPLDIINPLDYSDLSKLSNPQSIKIARPMIRASWAMGSFSKLEGIFVPWFQGHKFETDLFGRWTPSQVSGLIPALIGGLQSTILNDPGLEAMYPIIAGELAKMQDEIDIKKYYWDKDFSLRYAQAGMRFTTTIGSSDLGFQYYFGRFPRPSINIVLDDFIAGLPVVDPEAISVNVYYNYYHHIGIDFARVIAGFNMRAEAGANITKDTNGTDGAVENPAIVWSLGFDRDLFWGINLNMQGVGKFRLLHSKIGSSPLADCEAGTKLSSTRITGILSRKFLRDELELKTSALWGIEDKDFLIMPSVSWSRNDVSAEIAAGFFGGDRKGELGQYRDNGYIRFSLAYKF